MIKQEKFTSIEDVLKRLSGKRVRVLKIRIRRPTVTFIENTSMLSNKPF